MRISAIIFIFIIFSMARAQSETREPPPAQNLSLKAAAAISHRYIGSEVEAKLLRTDRTYSDTVKREFSIIVPQNEMKFGWFAKDRNHLDFTDADFIVAFAQAKDIKVRGHNLAWHQNNPDWLTKGHFGADELKSILIDHIQTEVTHFKTKFPGQVIAWDVVNEAIGADGKLRMDSIWNGVGNDPAEYIAIAFKAARAADPNAKLFYNDYAGELLNPKSDGIYQMISKLKSEGIPIDGIGFQMHFTDQSKLDLNSVRRNFERFEKLGLQIQITEFDFALPDHASAEQVQKQNQSYRDFSALCASIPACTAFLSWGFTDVHSWIPAFKKGMGHALYFDENYRPKPAYDSLRKGIQGHEK